MGRSARGTIRTTGRAGTGDGGTRRAGRRRPGRRRGHRRVALALALAGATAPAAEAALVSAPAIERQPVTLDVPGPLASETGTGPNPFLDVRLDATFTSPSGIAHRVPGFFAGNGLGHGTGNVWRARFTPDEPGRWRWSVDFDAGENVAVGDAPGTPLAEDGADGTFEVAPFDARAPGLLAAGRLDHVGGPRLRGADDAWWVGAGVDGPGNLLEHAGFDGAAPPATGPGASDHAAHVPDWREGDPDFASEDTGVDGRGVLGAINWLADRGVNSARLVALGLDREGRGAHPFVGAPGPAFDRTRYDVSKLFQWHLLLGHMQRRGVAVRLTLVDPGPDGPLRLDGGELGPERRLYHRELVARFAHLNALTWDVGGRGRHGPAREAAFARHLRALDWARHPIATPARAGLAASAPVDGPPPEIVSVRLGDTDAAERVEAWHARPADGDRGSVIDASAVVGGGPAPTREDLVRARRETLYPVYFGGGDLRWRVDGAAGDFRPLAPLHRWTRIAREFLTTYLPLGRAVPNDGAILGGARADRALSAPGEAHALHLPAAGGGRELEAGPGPWEIAWFDPEAGRFEGERRVEAGPRVALGEPPSAPGEDWVVLVRKVAPNAADAPPVAAAMPGTGEGIASPTSPVGTPDGPPAAGAAGDAGTGAVPGEADGGGGAGGGAALVALVLAGRLIRSRADATALVYSRAPLAPPESTPA